MPSRFALGGAGGIRIVARKKWHALLYSRMEGSFDCMAQLMAAGPKG